MTSNLHFKSSIPLSTAKNLKLAFLYPAGDIPTKYGLIVYLGADIGKFLGQVTDIYSVRKKIITNNKEPLPIITPKMQKKLMLLNRPL